MTKENLSPIQKEILTALEQFSERTTFSESHLAKKVRENTKMETGKKSGIALLDLEAAIEVLEENSVFYKIHLNSANDILVTKSEATQKLEGDARKRRQSSEKSMSVLTNGDLKSKEGNKNKQKHKTSFRAERKNININSNFEDFDE